jgi:hypothetical protein
MQQKTRLNRFGNSSHQQPTAEHSQYDYTDCDSLLPSPGFFQHAVVVVGPDAAQKQNVRVPDLIIDLGGRSRCVGKVQVQIRIDTVGRG